MTRLTPGLTRFLYNNDELTTLEGAVSVPIGTRVEIWEDGKPVDYIVDTARIGARETDFDLYYECHRAEETGTRDL